MKELKFSGGYVKRYWARYAAGIIALAAVDLMNVYILCQPDRGRVLRH